MKKHKEPEPIPSSSSSEGEEEIMKVFNLAESETDDSFWNNFCAVFSKRSLLYWTNKKQAFFEIFIPAIIMGVGIGCT